MHGLSDGGASRAKRTSCPCTRKAIVTPQTTPEVASAISGALELVTMAPLVKADLPESIVSGNRPCIKIGAVFCARSLLDHPTALRGRHEF